MSEEKIDETETAQSENNKKTSRFTWLNIGILCTAISIIVLIMAGAYSYWHLLSANISLANAATQTQNQLQQLQTDFNTLKTESDAAQQTMQQSIDAIKNLKQDNQEKWLLAEARYYITLANTTLQFAHNIPLAIVLLKMADQEMSRITDPKMVEVRKTIAADLANLQAAPQVDVTGLYMKLMAINTALDQLPLQVNQVNLQEQKITSAQEQKQTAWQRGLHTIWQALQSLVVIRHNSNGLMPLVTQEQQALLYQNLHAMLTQSIWALLHEQPQIYQSSLQQLTLWIKRAFVPDAPNTRAVLSDLAQLEKTDIHPALPAMTNTLQAVNGV